MSETMEARAEWTAAATSLDVQFTVVGIGPCIPDEERQLAQQMQAQSAMRSSAMLFHLGGTMAHADFECSAPYARLAELLEPHPGPQFFLPGPSEWGVWDRGDAEAWRRTFLDDCPDDAVSGDALDQRWLAGEVTARQPQHRENFARFQAGVLLLGFDLPGGEHAADDAAWDRQVEDAAAWLGEAMQACAGVARAVVIFTHAFPSLRHAAWTEALRETARRTALPILHLHADSEYLPDDRPHRTGPGHTHPPANRRWWCKDRPWPEKNIQRVQVERLAMAPPLVVTVAADAGAGEAVFRFNRQYFRGPYLNSSTPHSIAIAWRTEWPISPQIKVGRKPGVWDPSLAVSPIRLRTAKEGSPPLHSAQDAACQYDAVISGLQPATRYYYGIYDGDTLIAGGDEHCTFRTHPPAGSRDPARFWVFGDSGRGNQIQADVHDAMRQVTAAQRRPVDLFLHCGDMAYSSGTDAEFQKNFFRPYEPTLRHIPFWPTMSNHEGVTSDGATDTGPYYDAFVLPAEGEAGGVPSHTQSYFGFDYGNVHFLCLCSYGIDLGPDGAQAQWLRANLAHVRAQGTAQWLIAYFHHPPYTQGSHNSDTEQGLIDVREHIMPILEDGGVDLVLAGHSHIYERSMLIDGAYQTPTVAENCVLDDGDGDPTGDGPYRKSEAITPHEGTVAVVCGCGGTIVSRAGTSPVMKRILEENGSVLIDVEGSTLTVSMVNTRGEVRDRFAIERRGRVEPRRVARPRQLPPYFTYRRTRSTLAFEPVAGTADRFAALLEIPALPHDAYAVLEWDCEGTNWQMDTGSDRFALQRDKATTRPVKASCAGDRFPLPRATLTFEDAKGQTPGSLEILWPVAPSVALRRLPAAPTLDGVIDPELVVGLDRQERFVDFGTSMHAKVPTEFHAGVWGSGLYIAVTCHEPEMGRLYVSDPNGETAHGSDDCVEVVLYREHEPAEKYQFIVNVQGQRVAYQNGAKVSTAPPAAPWQSATARQADRWSAELLLDLDRLGGPLRPGEVIRLNVARNCAVHRQYTQWSYSRSPLDPRQLGRAVAP